MDCASPRLALFTSAVDGAPVGLELGWRGHQESVCHCGDEGHCKLMAPEVWSSIHPAVHAQLGVWPSTGPGRVLKLPSPYIHHFLKLVPTGPGNL